jgi:membrane protein implicated in regulation of membrane protease activity
MNFSAGSGGLMLVALAVVWFIVFLPSVSKRGQDKDDLARDRRVRRDRLTAQASPITALQVRRSNAAKVTFAAAAAIAAIASIVALFLGSAFWTIAGVSAAAVFAVFSRISALRVARAISTGANRRTKIGSGLDAQLIGEGEEQEFVDDRSWRPTEVPGQTYQAQRGTLESPTLADVVEIEFSQEFDSETLDEILRRRRAN